MIIVLLAISLSASIPGISKLLGLLRGPKIVKSVDYSYCQAYSLLDDVVIGKLTKDKTGFWTGLNNILASFDTLEGKTNDLKTTANTTFSAGSFTTMKGSGNTLITAIETI